MVKVSFATVVCTMSLWMWLLILGSLTTTTTVEATDHEIVGPRSLLFGQHAAAAGSRGAPLGAAVCVGLNVAIAPSHLR